MLTPQILSQIPICHRGGYLYVIQYQDEQLIKIGISTYPSHRLWNLQCQIPYPISLVCIYEFREIQQARDCERALHQKFAGQRVIGEWFAVDPNEILDTIDAKMVYPLSTIERAKQNFRSSFGVTR